MFPLEGALVVCVFQEICPLIKIVQFSGIKLYVIFPYYSFSLCVIHSDAFSLLILIIPDTILDFGNLCLLSFLPDQSG